MSHPTLDRKLTLAAKAGKTKEVTTLLKAGANINAYADKALKAAYSNGKKTTTKYLLKIGEYEQRKPSLALIACAAIGDKKKTINLLFQGAEIDPFHESECDRALHWAIHFEHVEIVEILLSNNALVDYNLGEALKMAIRNGNQDIVKLLIEFKATLDYSDDPEDSSEHTPIQLAAKEGEIEIIELLLNTGMDIHLDEDQILETAITHHQKETIKRLLQIGDYSENPDLEIEGRIHLEETDKACNLIIKYKEEILPINKTHLMGIACAHENLSITKLLLQLGADPDAENGIALTSTAEIGSLEMLQLLIEFGADPRINNDDAIKFAYMRKDYRIRKFLLHQYSNEDLNSLLGNDPLLNSIAGHELKRRHTISTQKVLKNEPLTEI